jgi:ketohexokinase
MLSKAFCESCGYDEPLECIDAAVSEGKILPGAIAVCTSGEKGAVASRDGCRWLSGAFPPAQVVDTVGAGDTFNAGLVNALHRAVQQGFDIKTHKSIPAQAIRYACQLAGAKVGMNGFQGLRDTQSPFIPCNNEN